MVRSSELDSLYQNLPVLIVDEWESMTQSLLVDTYNSWMSESKRVQWKWDKLWWPYWRDRVQGSEALGRDAMRRSVAEDKRTDNKQASEAGLRQGLGRHGEGEGEGEGEGCAAAVVPAHLLDSPRSSPPQSPKEAGCSIAEFSEVTDAGLLTISPVCATHGHAQFAFGCRREQLIPAGSRLTYAAPVNVLSAAAGEGAFEDSALCLWVWCRMSPSLPQVANFFVLPEPLSPTALRRAREAREDRPAGRGEPPNMLVLLLDSLNRGAWQSLMQHTSAALKKIHFAGETEVFDFSQAWAQHPPQTWANANSLLAGFRPPLWQAYACEVIPDSACVQGAKREWASEWVRLLDIEQKRSPFPKVTSYLFLQLSFVFCLLGIYFLGEKIFPVAHGRCGRS